MLMISLTHATMSDANLTYFYTITYDRYFIHFDGTLM